MVEKDLVIKMISRRMFDVLKKYSRILINGKNHDTQ